MGRPQLQLPLPNLHPSPNLHLLHRPQLQPQLLLLSLPQPLLLLQHRLLQQHSQHSQHRQQGEVNLLLQDEEPLEELLANNRQDVELLADNLLEGEEHHLDRQDEVSRLLPDEEVSNLLLDEEDKRPLQDEEVRQLQQDEEDRQLLQLEEVRVSQFVIKLYVLIMLIRC